MGLRSVKENARKQVHAAFSYPADYFAVGAVDPTPCDVRVNYNQQRINAGDIESEGFVERAEEDIVLRFLLSEIPAPQYGAKVRVYVRESDPTYYEEYIIQRTLPPYGLTQDCEVRML